MGVHSTSIIADGAKIGSNVIVGPFCYVGSKVLLKDGVELVSHVSLDGYLEIGENTKIYPFASLGHKPQDLKYKGEISKTIIGQNNQIREYVTIQPGTANSSMETKIGDNCLLMVGSHVAHDCTVGNNVIMANNATLAGHVVVGDHVIIGGLSAIKQFVKIGSYAIIGGMTGVEKDVIPYGMVIGERGWLNGLNLVGMKRKGFSKEKIQKIQKVYFEIFQDTKKPINTRVDEIKTKYCKDKDLQIFLDFFN